MLLARTASCRVTCRCIFDQIKANLIQPEKRQNVLKTRFLQKGPRFNGLRFTVFTNKKREGINTFVCATSIYVVETPKASINEHELPLPIISFGIVAYGLVGQPFSKQLYLSAGWQNTSTWNGVSFICRWFPVYFSFDSSPCCLSAVVSRIQAW